MSLWGGGFPDGRAGPRTPRSQCSFVNDRTCGRSLGGCRELAAWNIRGTLPFGCLSRMARGCLLRIAHLRDMYGRPRCACLFLRCSPLQYFAPGSFMGMRFGNTPDAYAAVQVRRQVAVRPHAVSPCEGKIRCGSMFRNSGHWGYSWQRWASS